MNRPYPTWAAALLLALIAVPGAFGADADTSDLEGWTSAELKCDIGKLWTATAEKQLRMKSDISEVDRHFSQLGLRFDAPHGFRLGAAARFIRRNDTQGKIQGYETQRRYQFDAMYRHKQGRVSLAYRVRYQTKGDIESGDFIDAEQHMRFKARARYNIRKWPLDPSFAVELYRPVGDEAPSEFDKVRYTLGTEWKAWGVGEVGVFYRLEEALGDTDEQTTHIVGLEFTYTVGWK